MTVKASDTNKVIFYKVGLNTESVVSPFVQDQSAIMWKTSPDGRFVKMFSVPCTESVYAVQIGIQHIALGFYGGDIEVTDMVQYRMAI